MSDSPDLGFHHLFRPNDRLYRWVHPEHVRAGVVLPAHCPTVQWREGLSCDWSVLATAEERAQRKAGSFPAHVLSVTVQECLDLGLVLRHCPVIDRQSPDFNLAHCLLLPPDPGKLAIRELRDRFLQLATVQHLVAGRIRSLLRLIRVLRPRSRLALRLIKSASVEG